MEIKRKKKAQRVNVHLISNFVKKKNFRLFFLPFSFVLFQFAFFFFLRSKEYFVQRRRERELKISKFKQTVPNH